MAKPELTREQWCYLADVLNGCAELYEHARTDHSGSFLVAEVEDGHILSRLGDKWFPGRGDDGAAVLADLVRAMTPEEATTVLATVRRFWESPSVSAEEFDWSTA